MCRLKRRRLSVWKFLAIRVFFLGRHTDEDLTQGTTSCKAQNVLPHSGILGHELNGRIQLASAASNVHSEPLSSTGRDERRAAEEVKGRNDGAHDVVGAHHLRPAERAKRLKDVILGTVGKTIKEEVDTQQQQTPRDVCLLGPGGLLMLAPRVEGEDGNAECHGGHDQVLVDGIALPEDCNVEEHDGEELAALGQQEGDVVDVRKAGVAKGTGQAVGDCDERERAEDAARREDGRHGSAFRGRGQEIDEADGGSEERLDRVEEDGEVPDLWCVGRAVRLGRQLLLKERPCQTFCARAYMLASLSKREETAASISRR